jgi:hypothetical protein
MNTFGGRGRERPHGETSLGLVDRRIWRNYLLPAQLAQLFYDPRRSRIVCQHDVPPNPQ